MRHRFAIEQALFSISGYKGIYYPGILLNMPPQQARGESYDIPTNYRERTMYTASGSPLRKENLFTGKLYFMPVYIGGVEMPNAIISMTGKKTIIETPLIGRSGSVKELISIDDYDISITGVLIGENDEYPEQLIIKIREVWEKNESVQLIAAINDLIQPNSEKVVLTSIDFPAVGTFEDAQIVKLSAVSDNPYELEIE